LEEGHVTFTVPKVKPNHNYIVARAYFVVVLRCDPYRSDTGQLSAPRVMSALNSQSAIRNEIRQSCHICSLTTVICIEPSGTRNLSKPILRQYDLSQPCIVSTASRVVTTLCIKSTTDHLWMTQIPRRGPRASLPFSPTPHATKSTNIDPQRLLDLSYIYIYICTL
jgi:hypothetical protein